MAAAIASRGHEVIGVDVNHRAVDAVNAGKAPVQETGLQDLIDANRTRLRATMSQAEAVRETELTFVIVPTPSDERGAFSLQYAVYAFREIGKALPPSEYPIVEVPLSHPIFHQQFDVKRVIQIPSINAWRGMGGGTSERGADSATPEARAIYDKQGHMMVFITHNTDFGDAFEQEAADPQYFYTFSVEGYQTGINVLLYALTH